MVDDGPILSDAALHCGVAAMRSEMVGEEYQQAAGVGSAGHPRGSVYGDEWYGCHFGAPDSV